MAIPLLKRALVVSCQAEPGDPLENVDALERIAMASIRGGADGLRLNSADCIAAVKKQTRLPIIGIKKVYPGGRVRITADIAAAAELARAGADIIALDCTDRTWPAGDPWRELIERIHRELHLPVMADIATLKEGLAAAAAGADMIGTTLHGYTEATRNSRNFNWQLLDDLIRETSRPVIAEGHVRTPSEAERAITAGAWAVVVGSAITRPGSITASFARAIRHSVNSDRVIGVDIGGTSIKAGLVDREGHITGSTRLPTNAAQGREAIAAATAQAIEQVLSAAHREGVAPRALGIVSAGVIDAEKGTVTAATENLPGWTGFDLRGFAEKQFQMRTSVENDAHAAALAEMCFGSARRFRSFVAITVGTGVGGGVIVNRELVRGGHGFAGAFGHSTIRQSGRPCTCGKSGCLEAYVAAAALAFEYQRRIGSATYAPGLADTELVLKISRLAAAKDPIALEAYSDVAGYLAEGVANLFNVLDPEAVVVSGGLVEGKPWLISEVEARVKQNLHFGALRNPRVQLGEAGHQTGILGAAAVAFQAQDRANL